MQHIGQVNVVDISTLASQQPRVFDPLHALADPSHALARLFALAANRNSCIRGGGAHYAASFFVVSNSTAYSTASTMFWYPVQRHRLPPMSSMMASRSGAEFT